MLERYRLGLAGIGVRFGRGGKGALGVSVVVVVDIPGIKQSNQSKITHPKYLQ